MVVFSTSNRSMYLLLWDLDQENYLDQVRDAIRLKHYSYRTEQTYVGWIRRYILFHNKRHPKNMGNAEVEAFLTHLAVEAKVSASTENPVFSALLFFIGRYCIKILVE